MILPGKDVKAMGLGMVMEPGASSHQKPSPLLDLKRQGTGLGHQAICFELCSAVEELGHR